MSKVKSNAQQRRMQKRAATRGETYSPPVFIPKKSVKQPKDLMRKKMSAARQLKRALSLLETNNGEINAKERRSAKRKAEAIAKEETGCETDELMIWFEKNDKVTDSQDKIIETDTIEKQPEVKQPIKNPYILFIGQLAYKTTIPAIFEHFKTNIGEVITKEQMQIRLPTNMDEGGTSKGFAFAQFSDPKVMYECLKLHQTQLDGRRINVYRGAPGGKSARKEKIKERVKEQEVFIDTTVDKILQDYRKNGHLSENELDEGVVALCKRRSAAIVESALGQYVEERGTKDMQNPSAYLNRIICRVTDEGILSRPNDSNKRMKNEKMRNKPMKKFNKGGTEKTDLLQNTSKFARNGIDMSVSRPTRGKSGLGTLFPSMSRGRGRGRGGYM